MTKGPTTIKGLIKNEIQSAEATLNRLKKILAQIEEIEAAQVMTAPEIINQFIEARCVIDPDAWESYERLYAAFEHYRAGEGIKTKILKKVFFEELAQRGHFQYKGRGLIIGQPDNGINGLYLRDLQEDIEEKKPQETDEEYIKRILEEQDRAEREEQERRFNAIIEQTEQEDSDTNPTPKRGLFDWN